MHILFIGKQKLFALSLEIALKKYKITLAFSSSKAQTHAYLKHYQPDILLIDLHTPDEESLQIATSVLYHYPTQKIVFLADSITMYRQQLRTLGAFGLLSKNISIQEMVEKLRQVHRNIKVFPSQPMHAQKILTKREQEILQLAALGYKHYEIAHHLNISRRTVSNHFQTITSKLGVKSTLAAVVQGINLGYVSTKERIAKK